MITLVSDGDDTEKKSAPLAHLLELHQFCWWHFQRRGQATDIDQRDITLPAFHAAQVTTRHARLQRQRLLRPAAHLAQLRQALAE